MIIKEFDELFYAVYRDILERNLSTMVVIVDAG